MSMKARRLKGRSPTRRTGPSHAQDKNVTAAKGESHLEEQFSATCLNLGLPAPTRQYQFHSVRKWLFDFAWPDVGVAVEVHGGTFIRGRHVTGKGFWADRIKTNAALRLNWKVFELVASDLADMRVLREIVWEIEARRQEGATPRAGIPFVDVHAESKSRRQLRAVRKARKNVPAN